MIRENLKRIQQIERKLALEIETQIAAGMPAASTIARWERAQDAYFAAARLGSMRKGLALLNQRALAASWAAEIERDRWDCVLPPC